MLPPGSTIGILGGGQLGRMLAVAWAIAPMSSPPTAKASPHRPPPA
jgi:phosphoribosylaminoimidazole carboxylase (NCAIR synthetase)